MQSIKIKEIWSKCFFFKKKNSIQLESEQSEKELYQEPFKQKSKSNETLNDSVLHRLIRDELTIVRIIKLDILINLRYSKKDISSSVLKSEAEKEINSMISDLMLFEKAKNKGELIGFYKRYIKESCTMISEISSVSVDDLAVNGFLELKSRRKWK